MTRRRWRALLPALVLVCATPAVAGDVAAVRIWSADDHTRVVLDLTGPVRHELFALSDPARVVVDLPGVALRADTLPPAHGFVKSLRSGEPKDGVLRLVLDLNADVQPRSFNVAPDGDQGHRLVIDLLAPGSGDAPAVKSAPASTGREIVVAIDPGHGGQDPGATGREGTREKDVVFAISKALKNKLDGERGVRAVLVRDGDYFMTHRGRMKRAREQRADLFVSIHADAFRDARAKGSTVYVLSNRGASSEAARWLADKQNAADLVGGVSLDDKDDVLASVLLDLSQTATLSASMEAGARVINHLGEAGRVRKQTVQQAGFLVLKSPDIPSILVETAFISNPDEEKRLRQARHQHAWASAIKQGIVDYFYSNPPPGTAFAARRAAERPDPLRYVIARGDTLAEIADRYNVALNLLRTSNDIRGDRIRIGQVLTIPPSGG